MAHLLFCCLIQGSAEGLAHSFLSSFSQALLHESAFIHGSACGLAQDAFCCGLFHDPCYLTQSCGDLPRELELGAAQDLLPKDFDSQGLGRLYEVALPNDGTGSWICLPHAFAC